MKQINETILPNGGHIDKQELINLIYPIGSIYMSVNNVSPQTFLGGEWTTWGGKSSSWCR